MQGKLSAAAPAAAAQLERADVHEAVHVHELEGMAPEASEDATGAAQAEVS